MPIVPRAPLPTQTAPLSTARLASQAPGAAFQPPEPVQLGTLQKVAQDVYDVQKQKGDQLAVLDADNQLSRFETDLLYDPKTGLLNRRGKDAFGIPDEADAAWQKHTSEIASKLSNETQRMAFQKMVEQRGNDIHLAVQRHVADETKKFDDTTTQSYVSDEQNAALVNYQDPDRVALSIRRQQDAIKLYAQRNGMPEEWTTEKTADAASKTHTAIINRLLSNGDDQAASQYYDRIKSQVVGADTVSVERSLEEGSTRGEAQRQSDAIVAGTTSRGDALAKARLIKDPKIRDLVEDRVNHHFDEVNAIQRETQDQLFLQSTNLVDARPGVPARSVIPPSIWTKLDLNQREALERRSSGGNGPNDDHRWLSFLDLRPDALGKMSQAQFESDYWSHFDGPHRERAAEQWAAARDALTTGKFTSPQLAATLTFKDRVDNTLRTSGLIPDKPLTKLGKDERKTYMAVETEAARQVQEYEMTQLGGKRKATGTEIQQILDNIVKDRVFVERPWRSDVEKAASLLTQDEHGLAYVPYDKVPLGDRNSIERLLKSKGRRITRDVVQRAYAAVVLNDRPLFDSIIGGSPTTAQPTVVTPPPVPLLR